MDSDASWTTCYVQKGWQFLCFDQAIILRSPILMKADNGRCMAQATCGATTGFSEPTLPLFIFSNGLLLLAKTAGRKEECRPCYIQRLLAWISRVTNNRQLRSPTTTDGHSQL